MSSDVVTKHDEKYKESFITTVVGGLRNGYFEYDLITETTDFENAMKGETYNFTKMVAKRTIQMKVLIPPIAFKDVVNLFMSQITDYEKVFGRIPTQQEIEDKKAGSDLK